MAVRGGKNLKRLLKKGQRAKGVDGVRVGLFSSAVYPRIGTGKHGKRSGYRKSRRRLPVTTVAAWIEFGTRSRSGKVIMKARPVMRSANVQLEQKVRALLRAHLDPEPWWSTAGSPTWSATSAFARTRKPSKPSGPRPSTRASTSGPLPTRLSITLPDK